MKTIKSICAAMVCCALVAGFSSCSKDDDGPNGPAVKMQLEGITITEGNSTTTLSNFVYDNQGRLTSYDVNDNGDNETVTYTYHSSYIEMNESDGYKRTYHIENGVITSIGTNTYDGTDSYEYLNGNMVKWTEDSRYYISYSWENGSPVRETVVNSGSSDYVTSFGYSELPCYMGNFQTLFDDYSSVQVEFIGGSFWDPFLQQQGYFGNLPKNLVTSAKAQRNSEWQLSYEVNANGYPTKIMGKDDSGSAVMTLTWR